MKTTLHGCDGLSAQQTEDQLISVPGNMRIWETRYFCIGNDDGVFYSAAQIPKTAAQDQQDLRNPGDSIL